MDKLPFFVNGKVVYVTYEITTNKNMYLKIKGEDIYVEAPKKIPLTKVKEFVSAHIENFVEHVDKKKANKLYDHQEMFIYLGGVQYKIVPLTGFLKSSYTITGKSVNYKLAIDSDEEKDKLRIKVLKDNLEPRLEKMFKEISKQMDVPPHTYVIKDITSKWGSNNIRTRQIIFALNIAHHDDETLRYLIIHELAHYFEPNHSSKFYDIVIKYMPNYKELRNKLKFIDE